MILPLIKRLFLVVLSILALIVVLSQSAPQNSAYLYNRYYSYYPYQRASYSRKPQVQSQSLKRQSTSAAAYNNYSTKLLNDLNAAIKAQNELSKQNNIKNIKRISKADEENAKFAGANNQEAEEESSRTALLLGNRFRRCFPFGRDAATASGTKSTTDQKEQGRFLFDLNVYNVYPSGGVGGVGNGYGCNGGLGGGLLGGGGGGGLLSGILSDSYAPPPPTPLQNFLGLFAPGILQNSLAVTTRPRPQQPIQSDAGDVNGADPAVDPTYNPRPIPPVRRPNRVFYDSAGAGPITPAQLIGGVATTVNGIIQQLTGNVQPVYPSYRSRSYG